MTPRLADDEPVATGVVPIKGLDWPPRWPTADEIDDADAPKQHGADTSDPDG